MTNTPNDPKATLSLAQVETHAANIARLIMTRKVTTLTPSQLINTVEEYCADDPRMTRSDINRIRIRTAQLLNRP